ncbi:MAG: FAD-dependent oxidoreductase [Victivallaceae bacterium]
MKKVLLTADFAVIGGGISGMCAAIAAARAGAKVVLMHDRPVLGGNASSEIRLWICGAHGDHLRETGIVEEFILENQYRNPEGNYSLWDSVLYSAIRREKNITLLLNTACLEAAMDGDRIASVTGYQSAAQTFFTVSAPLFADCSGDSVLAPLTGAEFRQGREARGEFDESIAPEEADLKTMGMSCLLQARETTEPHDFIAPEWANHYENDEAFTLRSPQLETWQNFWWIELGGTGDAIHDVDHCRDELQKIAFGVWDYLKNHPANRAKYRNWELEWVGALPGKRESRRYVGDVIMNQNDVARGGDFPDTVAYGGWTMDDHHPEGFHYPGKPTIFHPAPSPYGIPYRSLYSKNIANLMFAGRNISVTHSALSSTRVMATCGLLGEAVGTAAGLIKKYGCSPRDIYTSHLDELQQNLMKHDLYLPRLRYRVPAWTAAAELRASSGNPAGLRAGVNRVIDGRDLAWRTELGGSVEYRWDKPTFVPESRIIFDSDLARRVLNIVAMRFLDTPRYRLPESLVKKFRLESCDAAGVWSEVATIDDNFRRLALIPIGKEVTALRLTVLESWGCDKVKIFAWD